MKPWMLYPAGAALAAALTLASCEVDDGPLTVIPNDAPVVTIANAAGETIAMSGGDASSATIPVLGEDSIVTVTVTFTDPDGNLENFTPSSPGEGQIIEGGSAVVGGEPVGAADPNSFSVEYDLLAPAEEEGTRTFTFQVVDMGVGDGQFVDQAEASVTLRRFTELNDSTDAELNFNIVDTTMAGFDLDNDEAVDYDAETDSVTEFIALFDTAAFDLPAIRAVGDARLRTLGGDDSLGVETYNSLEFEQDLTDLYDRSDAAAGGVIQGIAADDVFVVNNGNRFWIVRVNGIDSTDVVDPINMDVSRVPSSISFDYRQAIISDED